MLIWSENTSSLLNFNFNSNFITVTIIGARIANESVNYDFIKPVIEQIIEATNKIK